MRGKQAEIVRALPRLFAPHEKRQKETQKSGQPFMRLPGRFYVI